MHRDQDQSALAAAINRADLRLRRAILIHGPAVCRAIKVGDYMAESQRSYLIYRYERRLRMLCAAAWPAGPARRAAVAVMPTLQVSMTWTADCWK
jgi:hypothetical protein